MLLLLLQRAALVLLWYSTRDHALAPRTSLVSCSDVRPTKPQSVPSKDAVDAQTREAALQKLLRLARHKPPPPAAVAGADAGSNTSILIEPEYPWEGDVHAEGTVLYDEAAAECASCGLPAPEA